MQITQALKSLNVGLIEGSDTATLDAQVLLAHIMEKDRSWVLAHPEYELKDAQQATLQKVLSQLDSKTPLPYILGEWEFFGLKFCLNPQVLIPRPETELLVETALQWLGSHFEQRWALDVGTGSGCIAVSLAYHRSDLNIFASDIYLPALLLARENAKRYHLSNRIAFIQCDLLPPLERKIDLLCANLPYIPSQSLANLPIFEREPSLALDGGVDGLLYIRRLLERTPQRLAAGGALLCEIESSQATLVTDIARSIYPCADIRVLPDLAGLDRLLTVQT